MTNTVEPLVSPEKLPATSFAAVPFSSPACVAGTRALPVSAEAEAGANLGRAGVLAGRYSVGPAQPL